MRTRLVLLLLLGMCPGIASAAVDLTAKIAPKNDGFQGLVDDDQVIDTAATAGNVLVSGGAYFASSTKAAAGLVSGPASAFDNAAARFDATTGKIIQNSRLLIGDLSTDQFSLTFDTDIADGVLTWIGDSDYFSLADSIRFNGSAFTVLNAPVLIGANLAGVDATIYGDTSGSFMQWEDSVNRLELRTDVGTAQLRLADDATTYADFRTNTSGILYLTSTTEGVAGVNPAKFSILNNTTTPLSGFFGLDNNQDEETYIDFQAGLTAEQKRYVRWKDSAGSIVYQMGTNALTPAHFILFDQGNAHVWDFIKGGQSNIGSMGTAAVCINCTTLDTGGGTGGLIVKDGGTTRKDMFHANQTEVAVNEDDTDIDFRAETDNNISAFLIDSSADTITSGVPHNFSDVLRLLSTAAPTIDAAGELALDSDLWAASRGTPVVWDGTAATALVNTLVSDVPTNGQVPTWNTGGTITWETPTGGSGSPGGADTQLQYNDGGTFGGLATLTWDDTNFLLGAGAATKLQFRDTNIYISSIADSYLDFTADGGFRFRNPVANTDLYFLFDGTSNYGELYWMEDEGYFKWMDGLLMNSTQAVYWGDINTNINWNSTNMVITDDATIQMVSPVVDINASTGLALDGANLNSAWTVNSTNKIQFGDANSFIHHDGTNLLIQDDVKVTIGVAGPIDLGDGTLRIMRPLVDSKIDLGDSTHEFNDVYVDGTVETDALRIDEGGSTTISTGVGSVKMSSVNAATNTVWIPINYNGTVYYVPGWTTNSP